MEDLIRLTEFICRLWRGYQMAFTIRLALLYSSKSLRGRTLVLEMLEGRGNTTTGDTLLIQSLKSEDKPKTLVDL